MKFIHAVVIVGCAMLAACTTQTDVVFNQGGPYRKSVESIFRRSCNTADCHAAARDSCGNLALSSYAALIAGSRYGNVVVPYNSAHSDLFQHINNDTTIAEIASPVMPPSDTTRWPAITQADRDTIRQWIDNGCKADDGTIPYPVHPGVVFVTNQSEDIIAVIDTATQQVIRYVHAGVGDPFTSQPNSPHNVVVDAQGQYFYTTLVARGELWKIDCNALQVVGTAKVGTSPAHVVLNATGDTAYVTNWDATAKTSRSVVVVATNGMTVTDTISDQRMIAPHGARISHDGKFLYTANQYGDNVSKIDLAAKKVSAIIPLAADVPLFPPDDWAPRYQPFQVALTDYFVYVTCRASNDVRVISIATDSVVAVIPVGKGPIQDRTSPDGRWVLVANHDDSSVTVISTISNSVFKTIQDVGQQPHGVDITADGRLAYVTCESQTGAFVHHPTTGSHKPGTTAVIDMTRFEQVPVKAGLDIEMGSFPAGVCVWGRTY